MKNLIFDLETIPSQQQWVRDSICDNIKPPGNIKKDESIQKWFHEKADEAIDDKVAKTSFNGAVGEIICIGYALDDGEVNLAGRMLGESEGDMIQNFIDAIVSSETKYKHADDVKQKYQWIGHWITGFDLHFLWQRCIVHGIKMPFVIPHTAKPWHESVFDTCHEWKPDNKDSNKGFGSLDAVMKCLGIESKNDGTIDGSKVWGLIQAGEYDKVFEYCKGDVADARSVYNRLIGRTTV